MPFLYLHNPSIFLLSIKVSYLNDEIIYLERKQQRQCNIMPILNRSGRALHFTTYLEPGCCWILSNILRYSYLIRQGN